MLRLVIMKFSSSSNSVHRFRESTVVAPITFAPAQVYSFKSENINAAAKFCIKTRKNISITSGLQF